MTSRRLEDIISRASYDVPPDAQSIVLPDGRRARVFTAEQDGVHSAWLVLPGIIVTGDTETDAIECLRDVVAMMASEHPQRSLFRHEIGVAYPVLTPDIDIFPGAFGIEGQNSLSEAILKMQEASADSTITDGVKSIIAAGNSFAPTMREPNRAERRAAKKR